MFNNYNPGQYVDNDTHIGLHKNENLFIDKEFMNKLLTETISDISLSKYPDHSCSELKDKLALIHKVASENIYIGNGSDGVLADLFAILRFKFTDVALPETGYKVYDILAAKYKYNITRLAKKIENTDKLKTNELCVLDSPNAVTGEVINEDVVLPKLSKQFKFVIWDNCYQEYINSTFYINRVNKFDNVISIYTFSKFYGLAGMRVGYCIAPKQIVEELEYWKEVYNVNIFGQALATNSLKHLCYYIERANQMQEVKKHFLKSLIELGFQHTESRANFIFVTPPQGNGVDLQNFLSKKQILVNRFEYPNINNYIRIAIAPEQIMQTVLNEIQFYLRKK